jgi:DNA adenine methylase
MPKKILTPLRYPGGKSRAIKHIDNRLPRDFSEYREPFIGGGSIFLYLKQFNNSAKYRINDKYYNLYCFWKTLRDRGDEMVKFLSDIREKYPTEESCSEIFKTAKKDIASADDFTKGCYFFLLNKCSYSGLTETGTFSPQASVSNFSKSCINYLSEVSPMLKGVDITNEDYSSLLSNDGDNVYIFLDPPYDILVKSKNNALYGKDGEHHKHFNHEKFYADVDACTHKWSITYNYSQVLIDRWKKYNCIEWKLKYGMQWEKDDNGVNKAKEKSELLITNF